MPEEKRGAKPLFIRDEPGKENFLKAIKIGMPYKACCEYAEWSESVFYRWKQLDQAGEEPYVSFMNEVRKAESQAKVKLLSDIHNDPSWQSKSWILERRWPNEFGRIERVQLDGELTTHKETIDLSQLSDDELDQLGELIEQSSVKDQAGEE